MYGPIKRESSKKETQYVQRMDILFSDKEFTETISCLAAALHCYLTCVEKYQISIDSENSYKLMADFSVLSLEVNCRYIFLVFQMHFVFIILFIRLFINALACPLDDQKSPKMV